MKQGWKHGEARGRFLLLFFAKNEAEEPSLCFPHVRTTLAFFEDLCKEQSANALISHDKHETI
ncbi:hypothetical protein J2S19_004819 [Metabacillus malikii]|uniref:Uncharacterized protein n=1 Tax=Metabacillus malikii TaxID=1504265 RepID=A0ABT9ZMF2_9BACI|nr:hypothetical protein [Metabacillus malikii]